MLQAEWDSLSDGNPAVQLVNVLNAVSFFCVNVFLPLCFCVALDKLYYKRWDNDSR